MISRHSPTDARKRTRVLIITATLVLFFTALRSTDRGGNDLNRGRGGLERPSKQDVSLTDSQRALKQLKEISEGSKSAKADAERKHTKVDPVSVTKVVTETTTTTMKPTKTAIIVTCPACRLNALPSVKKFVYKVAPYFKPHLNVNFIRGMDPVLHLYEDGKEIEKIDLHPYTWEDVIQKLVKFGIQPTSDYEPIKEVIKKMNLS